MCGKLAIGGGSPVHDSSWPKWPFVDERERALTAEVLMGGNWSYNGPKETEFREKWAGFCGTKYAVPVANGTVSLQLIYEALGIGWGDEVIVPALTWQATAAAVLDVNATPVLADVEEDSWCIDPAMIERAVTPRTKAIVGTHLYGSLCDMDGINALAKRHGLYVVEDSAHQHGTVFKGKKTGALGDAASFSLQNSKSLTCGEGGAITTDNDALAEKLDALRNCGRRPIKRELYDKSTGNYVIEGNFIQSGNYRITEFQAAVLLGQLEKLPGQIRRREENGLYLRSLLEGIEGVQNTRRRDGIEVQTYYNFAFRYDKTAFGGLPAQKFREALSAELNFPFTSCYQPLTNCDLYRPLTKKRHKISEEYQAAIDPSRFSAPAAERVFTETSVCAHHALLLGTKKDMDDIAEAILKIRANVGELM